MCTLYLLTTHYACHRHRRKYAIVKDKREEQINISSVSGNPIERIGNDTYTIRFYFISLIINSVTSIILLCPSLMVENQLIDILRVIYCWILMNLMKVKERGGAHILKSSVRSLMFFSNLEEAAHSSTSWYHTSRKTALLIVHQSIY